MSRFIIFISLFIFSKISFGIEPVCFSDLNEHNTIKSNLPAVIQKPPLFYTGTILGTFAMVAIKVEFDPKNNKFIVNVHSRDSTEPEAKEFDQYQKFVKEICINGNTLTITPEGGPIITAVVKSSTEISIKDPKKPTKELITVDLKKTRADYNTLVTKINNLNPKFIQSPPRPTTSPKPDSERAAQ